MHFKVTPLCIMLAFVLMNYYKTVWNSFIEMLLMFSLNCAVFVQCLEINAGFVQSPEVLNSLILAMFHC